MSTLDGLPEIYDTKYIPDANTKNYTDVDLNFIPHPVTGDLVKKTGIEAIKNSLRHIVYYNFYEKPFHPEIGTGLLSSLFETAIDPTTLNILERKIRSAIHTYEQRVSSLSVKINYEESEPNTIFVTIFFVPDGQTVTSKLDLFLSPVR